MLVLRFHTIFALLLALSPTLAGTAALAASEPTPSEISVARRLFAEGKAAEDAGRYREAADKFRRALAIKDTPGIRFHLARCEEEQGAFVEALVEYDRARELIDNGTKAADVEKLLAGARERVRAKLAVLTLRLPANVSSATVELDGKALSASVLGAALPINPGKHRLRVVATGRASFVSEIELASGELRQIDIALPVEPSRAPAAAAAPSANTAPRSERVAPARVADSAISPRTLVLVGEATLAAAALSTGIVFTIAKGGADDRYQTANEVVLSQVGGSDPTGTACAVPRAGCADLENARQERKRDAAVATASFIAAGVSAAAFGLTLGLWRGHAPASVHATAAPGRMSLTVSGRF